MRKILILTILGFILIGCSNSENNKEEVINLNNSNNLFSKKLECSEMDINDDIKNNWGKFAEKYTIDEVFYSEQNNTCIGIITLYGEGIRDIWGYDILEKKWFLSKFLTSFGNCNFSDEDLPDICIKQEKEFDETINNLRK